LYFRSRCRGKTRRHSWAQEPRDEVTESSPSACGFPGNTRSGNETRSRRVPRSRACAPPYGVPKVGRARLHRPHPGEPSILNKPGHCCETPSRIGRAPSGSFSRPRAAARTPGWTIPNRGPVPPKPSPCFRPVLLSQLGHEEQHTQRRGGPMAVLPQKSR
jgi:hypothetical protein